MKKYELNFEELEMVTGGEAAAETADVMKEDLLGHNNDKDAGFFVGIYTNW